MDVLAVVGSQEWLDPDILLTAGVLIDALLWDRPPDLLVSGGAPGIDSLAARLARTHHIPCEEFLPRHFRWEPEGFKERNIKIAQTCTRLVVVRNAASRTFGSGWTAEYAARQGKPTTGWILHPDGRVETYVPGLPRLLPTDTLF